MRRLRLGDKILRVRDEPEPPPTGGRAPLVCVHGAGMSSVVWMDVVRRIAAGGSRRIIAPDLPGHGQSDRWHETLSIDGYREAVGTVCARLRVARAVLMGHSMGAAIALRCALAWPERVSALVLVGGGGALRVDREVLALLDASLPQRAGEFVDRMPDSLAALSFSPETPEELRRRWQAVLLAAPREVVLDDFRACDGFDVMAQLPLLRLPVLLIGGGDDLLVPPRLLEESCRRIPGAQLHLIARAGHLPHLEQPDRFHDVLEPFLRSV
jgi:pimeloyl-ACP methyl ester carboxylesterase